MPRYSEEFENFTSVHSELITKVKTIPKSPGVISPGDVLAFNYISEDFRYPDEGTRILLVVSNQDGNGTYVSPRKNILLSGFKLEDKSRDIVRAILKHLYKNRLKCNYRKIIDSLNALLGKRSYRTYKLTHLTDLAMIEFSTDIHK